MSLSDDVDLEVFVMSKDDLSGTYIDTYLHIYIQIHIGYRHAPPFSSRDLPMLFFCIPFYLHHSYFYSPFLLFLSLHFITLHCSITTHYDRCWYQGSMHRSWITRIERAQNESYSRWFCEGEGKDIVQEEREHSWRTLPLRKGEKEERRGREGKYRLISCGECIKSMNMICYDMMMIYWQIFRHGMELKYLFIVFIIIMMWYSDIVI